MRSAWLRQPSRSPTTRTTGRPSATARSRASSAGPRGTRNPPTPSTTVKCAGADRRRCASTGCQRDVRPSRAAAMCGAIGSRSSTGVIAPDAAGQPAAFASASVSSLAHEPSRWSRPPRRASSARPQPPGAKGMHQRAGDERLAHARVGAGHEDAVAHRRPVGEKLMTWRPSSRRFGGTFHAWP